MIFRQTRVGRYGEHFVIYKFRSMRADAPHDASPYELQDADRYITTIGKILRKTSLDELPQLFNIIKGDMSLVGPRPAGINDKERIKLRRRLGADSVRPGLTGWAQVNGRDSISETEKVALDAYYVSYIGASMDIKCILKTVFVVLSHAGNVEGNELVRVPVVEMADFNGEEIA